MRRTVATLLVVASPLLLATPVGAGDDPLTRGSAAAAVAPAVPAPAPAAALPPVAEPATAVPALPAAPAVTTPAAPAPVRHAVKPVRAKPRAVAAGVSDAAYTAKLQAELCAARQIFCGLASNGRYPTR